MTIEEAEQIGFTLKSINDLKALDSRLRKLHKEEKHEEVARIALELKSELLRKYEDKLSSYPSLNGR